MAKAMIEAEGDEAVRASLAELPKLMATLGVSGGADLPGGSSEGADGPPLGRVPTRELHELAILRHNLAGWPEATQPVDVVDVLRHLRQMIVSEAPA